MTTMTTTKVSLAAFLKTPHGRCAVASFVGVHESDPALLFQCRANAIDWMPCSVLRDWGLSDLIKAALQVDAAGVWRAKEVAL